MMTASHYFSSRPLWGDEELVLKNIQAPGYSSIFAKFVEPQLFPRVQLTVVKFIAAHFNNNVWSLRFISFITMLTAFWVWIPVFKRLKDPHLIWLAVLSFVASFRLVYYASELKPYAMDVVSSGLFCWFLLYVSEQGDRVQNFAALKPTTNNQQPTTGALYLMLGACLLPLLLFWSYGAFFLFWLVPVQFFLLSLKDKKWRPYLWASVASSVLCFIIFYFIDLRFSLNIHATYDYWDSYFISTHSVKDFFATFFDGTRKLVAFWFGNTKAFIRLGTPLIPIFVIGLFYNGIKDWQANKIAISSVMVIALVIFTELFLFGIFRKYPFTGERITLFFAPLVFYVLIKTLDGMKKIRLLGTVCMIYYVGFCFFSLINTAVFFVRTFR
ncbi:MAG: hypothetical protein HQL26_05815 [Candidatus Omnitrophica bacterium]|nr:hypothetical protein [Candidatus Omnitrophota bacterium]